MDIDIRGKLLAGLPILVDKTLIYPLTLKEIFNYGYINYQKNLWIFTEKIEDIFEDVPDEYKELNTFDIFLNFEGDNENFISSLKLFFKEEAIVINKQIQIIALPNKQIIDRNNWIRFCEAINLQNNKNKKNEIEQYNPKSAKAKEIADKLKRAKEKINKVKAKNNEDLDLLDLISAFASYNKNVNILDVWNMTMYQFNDQFQRMQLWNDYDISIQSLLHGADSKKIDIKHFVCKLN